MNRLTAIVIYGFVTVMAAGLALMIFEHFLNHQ